MNNYKTVGHAKFRLQYHLIFSTKYRHRIFENTNISSRVKSLSLEIATKHNVVIKIMETDIDHIHYLISTRPNTNLCRFISTLKSYVAYHINQEFDLSKWFWNKNTLFTDGYFISTIGEVSNKTLKRYIANQG